MQPASVLAERPSATLLRLGAEVEDVTFDFGVPRDPGTRVLEEDNIDVAWLKGGQLAWEGVKQGAKKAAPQVLRIPANMSPQIRAILARRPASAPKASKLSPFAAAGAGAASWWVLGLALEFATGYESGSVTTVGGRDVTLDVLLRGSSIRVRSPDGMYGADYNETLSSEGHDVYTVVDRETGATLVLAEKIGDQWLVADSRSDGWELPVVESKGAPGLTRPGGVGPTLAKEPGPTEVPKTGRALLLGADVDTPQEIPGKDLGEGHEGGTEDGELAPPQPIVVKPRVTRWEYNESTGWWEERDERGQVWAWSRDDPRAAGGRRLVDVGFRPTRYGFRGPDGLLYPVTVDGNKLTLRPRGSDPLPPAVAQAFVALLEQHTAWVRDLNLSMVQVSLEGNAPPDRQLQVPTWEPGEEQIFSHEGVRLQVWDDGTGMAWGASGRRELDARDTWITALYLSNPGTPIRREEIVRLLPPELGTLADGKLRQLLSMLNSVSPGQFARRTEDGASRAVVVSDADLRTAHPNYAAYGPLEWNDHTRQLFVHGVEVVLTPREYAFFQGALAEDLSSFSRPREHTRSINAKVRAALGARDPSFTLLVRDPERGHGLAPELRLPRPLRIVNTRNPAVVVGTKRLERRDGGYLLDTGSAQVTLEPDVGSILWRVWSRPRQIHSGQTLSTVPRDAGTTAVDVATIFTRLRTTLEGEGIDVASVVEHVPGVGYTVPPAPRIESAEITREQAGAAQVVIEQEGGVPVVRFRTSPDAPSVGELRIGGVLVQGKLDEAGRIWWWVGPPGRLTRTGPDEAGVESGTPLEGHPLFATALGVSEYGGATLERVPSAGPRTRWVLTWDGLRVTLSNAEGLVMQELLTHPDQDRTHAQLHAAFSDTPAADLAKSIDNIVHDIYERVAAEAAQAADAGERKKVRPFSLIQNVPGIGFRARAIETVRFGEGELMPIERGWFRYSASGYPPVDVPPGRGNVLHRLMRDPTRIHSDETLYLSYPGTKGGDAKVANALVKELRDTIPHLPDIHRVRGRGYSFWVDRPDVRRMLVATDGAPVFERHGVLEFSAALDQCYSRGARCPNFPAGGGAVLSRLLGPGGQGVTEDMLVAELGVTPRLIRTVTEIANREREKGDLVLGRRSGGYDVHRERLGHATTSLDGWQIMRDRGEVLFTHVAGERTNILLLGGHAIQGRIDARGRVQWRVNNGEEAKWTKPETLREGKGARAHPLLKTAVE